MLPVGIIRKKLNHEGGTKIRINAFIIPLLRRQTIKFEKV